MLNRVEQIAFALLLSLIGSIASASNLVDIKFSSLPGDVAEMELIFDGQPPKAGGYTIEKPARIALDLPDTQSLLKTKYHKIGTGNARTATVVGTKNRSRIIVNLDELVAYSVKAQGNSLIVRMGESSSSGVVSSNNIGSKTSNSITNDESRVVNVDFRRGDQGDGQVQILLNQPNAKVDMVQQGNRVKVTLFDTKLPESIQRRLDVADFATPVKFIDTQREGDHVVIWVEPEGEYEYLAYQADNLLSVNVKPISKKVKKEALKEDFIYTGEKLSLNFQDIDVRAVLQLIADFTGQNLVASDTVEGGITLRLQNVPWDQALDLVLKTKGLAKRQMGNVLLVAPAEEIAAREKIELEAVRQVEELAPLRSEFIQLRYAKALDLQPILGGAEGAVGLLSERGSAVIDERTNTIILKDVADNLERIRQTVLLLDIPVRQVSIEAKIVIASTDVGEKLGIRWGGSYGKNENNRFLMAGGSSQTITEQNQILVNDVKIARGEDVDRGSINFPDAYAVNLGVDDADATSFAVGLNTFDYLLELELSAIETDGKAEVVSQPRVVTADGQTATIESGTEIPYLQQSSSGAANVAFKSAVLKLEVTPQITPDDRIIMDLEINQDSIGQLTAAGPSIDTNALETQVLVSNGETVVLGGIFRSQEIINTTKTPFLGDLPYIGALFRRTEYTDEKSELLIFVTPRLIKDDLTVN